MHFIDTHTHIYSSEFDRDRADMIRRAKENLVEQLLLPAIDSTWHEKMLQVVVEYPGTCYPMMGLHPTSVKKDYKSELDLVKAYLDKPGQHFCAIGEIGIDLYWDKTHEKEQREAFSFQLGLAVEHDLPVVIHTRNSMDIALSMVQEMNDRRLRGVFHCFSGNARQAEQAVGLGFLLGIGGVLTYKNSGLQAVVEHTSLEYLLLETDAPWLPPVPYRGQRNEPAYIPVIAQKVAEIKNIPMDRVAGTTSANATKLFKTDNP